MKPKEFDELVRQKFDQNDFAYDPGNWNRLSKELDVREKKRNLMFWWAPLLGMAATMALAIGVTTVLHEGGLDTSRSANEYALIAQPAERSMTVQNDVAMDLSSSTQVPDPARQHTAPKETAREDISGWFKIRMENAVPGNTYASTRKAAVAEHSLLNDETDKKKVNRKIPVEKAIYTFKEEHIEKKEPKASIILGGGLNYGAKNSGYAVGATARTMVSDRVYVEGEVAFVGSNNTQSTLYLAPGGHSTGRSKSSKNSSGGDALDINDPSTKGVIKSADQSYNLYYAQVTPSVGCKITRKLCLAAGPDFQQMLVDNRPAPSTVDRNTIKEAPMFDMGLMGKTEYAVTRNLKAAVYYREGINNVVTPMGKYIDRNYVQFQVKCAIFNKK